MKINSRKWLGVSALYLLLAETALILLSWILSATMMEGVRSLLSSEGVRWFVGSFSDMQATPLLVWFILLLSAFGSFQRSGAATLFGASSLFTYRDKIALRVAVIFLVTLGGL